MFQVVYLKDVDVFFFGGGDVIHGDVSNTLKVLAAINLWQKVWRGETALP